MLLINRRTTGFTLCLLIFCGAIASMAQQKASVDRVAPLLKFTGSLSGADGRPLSGSQQLTFLLYKEESGGAPLWMETHNVQADKNGHYSVTLGSAAAHGLPAEVFMSGEARWLSKRVNGGEEQARVLLLSIPYTLKTAEAENLSTAGSALALAPAEQLNEIVCASGTACKAGFVPLFGSNGGSARVHNSRLFQSGNNIGIGNTAPAFALDVVGDIHNIGSVLSNGGEFSVVSTNTLNAASGGNVINATMSGTGNSIAAIQGSATATGAAGFTFGVIGQSASDNGRGVFGLAPGAGGVGVIGETTGSSGVGVVGKTLNGQGWAYSASGNASQDRASGGWAKALVSVEGAGAPYHIIHCFNSTLPGSSATTVPCGFNLLEVGFAQFNIDFGFEVDDRYFSVSAEPFFVSGNNGAIIADAWANAVLGKNSIVQVDMYTDGGDRQTTNFTLIVY